MYIVSKCLLGENCKYNGGNNRNEDVVAFCKTHPYLAVCPETAGGLPMPRPPAEYTAPGRIEDRDGKDVTAFFEAGAESCLNRVIQQETEGVRIEGAILKANSPSCGSGQIYDGTFSGVLTEGYGCFAAKLAARGITVISEKEIKNGKF